MTSKYPAFPHPEFDGRGITKREYAAIAALQGLLANSQGHTVPYEKAAQQAVDHADALFERLREK